MRWNRIFWIIMASLLLAGTLPSCASRKSNCNCPNDINGKQKPPRSYKRNVY